MVSIKDIMKHLGELTQFPVETINTLRPKDNVPKRKKSVWEVQYFLQIVSQASARPINSIIDQMRREADEMDSFMPYCGLSIEEAIQVATEFYATNNLNFLQEEQDRLLDGIAQKDNEVCLIITARPIYKG